MDVFQAGVAVKPSLLGGSQREKLESLIQITQLLDRLNYRLLVIDSERDVDDLAPETFSMLLRATVGCGVTSVITLPVRRDDFPSRLADVCGILGVCGVGGLCLVAGNPAYLSEREASRRAGRALVQAAVRIRECGLDCMLLVGTENLVGPAVEAARRAGAIPFALLNDHDEIVRLKALTGGPVAVYTPFYIGDGLDEVWRILASYVRRRGYRGRLAEGVERHTLVGDVARVRDRVADLRRCGADLMVGFPAKLGLEQLMAFSRAVEY